MTPTEQLYFDFDASVYREIPLSQGQIAIVDSADYDWLMNWRWYAAWTKSTGSFYAQTRQRDSGKTIQMQRLILGLETGDEKIGDHVNRNTLDNRRGNLRVCNAAENAHNRRRVLCNTSGFKGVFFEKGCNKWRAQIVVNKKKIHLGLFLSPEEAHTAYRVAAVELHREFARTV